MPRISAYTAITDLAGSELFVVVDAPDTVGGTKKMTAANVAKSAAFSSLYLSMIVVDSATYGGGVVDATTHIQSKIDAAVAAGKTAYIPAGTYKLSASLTISSYNTGWSIQGAGAATILKQSTSNTPIFSLANYGMSGWKISDLSLDWATQQTVANTSAIGFAFGSGGAQPASSGHYNFEISRITFDRGFVGIAQTNHAIVNPVWGCRIKDLWFGPTWAGQAVDLTNTGGSPNVAIDRIYVRADNMTVAPVFNFSGMHGATFSNVEVNVCSLANELLVTSSQNFLVSNYRTETGTISVGTYVGTLLFSGSVAIVDGLELQTKTYTAVWNFAVQAQAASDVSVRNVRAVSITSAGGQQAAISTSGSWIKYDNIVGFGTVAYPYETDLDNKVGWQNGTLTFGTDSTFERVAGAVLAVGAANCIRTGKNVTGSRPAAATVGVGAQFYDTTLGKPIWSNGTVWKDAAGTTV